MSARRYLCIVLGCFLAASSCSDCSDTSLRKGRYRYIEYEYRGQVYRQYYDKPNADQGRLITYQRVTRPDGKYEWKPIGEANKGLGDIIEASALRVDEGVTFGLPNQLRPAAQTLPRRAYLLDVSAQERIVAVNPDSNTVLETLPLQSNAGRHLEISPDRRTLYVAHIGSPPALSVIATQPLRYLRRHVLPASVEWIQTEDGIAISPDARSLYVAGRGSVYRLDPENGAVLNRIEGPSGPLVLSPDGNLLFATGTARLYVIDTRTQTVATSLTTTSAASIAIDPSGSTLYLASAVAPRIAVFDVVSATFGSPIDLPNARRCEQLVLSFDGEDLFVRDDTGGAIHVVNLITRLIDRIAVDGPRSVLAASR
jgi:WD40 repeat protein